MTNKHNENDRLLAYAANELEPHEAAEIEALLKANTEMAATVERYRTVLNTVRADDSVSPPADVLAAAKALFRERPRPATPSWFDNLRRVIAELAYDGRRENALVGVRGGQRTTQFSFASELADVDLEVEVHDSSKVRRSVRGQIMLHQGFAAERVALVEPDTDHLVASVAPDADGMFTISADVGTYDIVLAGKDALLVLANVELT